MKKKQTDYAIPLIGFIILVAVLAASCGNSKNYQTSPCWKGKEPRHRTSKMRASIIKQNKDERGLISVIYVENRKDTFAFDYLTRLEFDSIFPNIAKN